MPKQRISIQKEITQRLPRLTLEEKKDFIPYILERSLGRLDISTLRRSITNSNESAKDRLLLLGSIDNHLNLTCGTDPATT